MNEYICFICRKTYDWRESTATEVKAGYCSQECQQAGANKFVLFPRLTPASMSSET